jgi:enoyl-CoA hydratase/carnithine racemase
VPYTNILSDLEGPVALIRVHRPDKLNALDILTLHELIAALREAQADPRVAVVVLTGEGRPSSRAPTSARWPP